MIYFYSEIFLKFWDNNAFTTENIKVGHVKNYYPESIQILLFIFQHIFIYLLLIKFLPHLTISFMLFNHFFFFGKNKIFETLQLTPSSLKYYYIWIQVYFIKSKEFCFFFFTKKEYKILENVKLKVYPLTTQSTI